MVWVSCWSDKAGSCSLPGGHWTAGSPIGTPQTPRDRQALGSRALELGKLVVAPLSRRRRPALLTGRELPLAGAQLDAPDLAGDRLGQVEELQAAHPLVVRQLLTGVL